MADQIKHSGRDSANTTQTKEVYQGMTDSAAHVTVKSSDVALAAQYFYTDGVSAKTAAALLTTGDISTYSHGIVTISGLTGETVAITALLDGTVESGAIKSTTTAGVDAASATLGNGTFYLTDLACKNLKFTKSAAVESATITLALKA